jgi:hypothetical protein
MAIDFKVKYASLKEKDLSPLTHIELQYIKDVEDYIDSLIEERITTDTIEIWVDICYVNFSFNPINKKPYSYITSTRKKFLQEALLSLYEKANWKVSWHIDDGLDGPNMSGGDYLILKGKK